MLCKTRTLLACMCMQMFVFTFHPVVTFFFSHSISKDKNTSSLSHVISVSFNAPPPLSHGHTFLQHRVLKPYFRGKNVA